MSEEKDKKGLNQDKPEPNKSEAVNEDNNPKVSPKEKPTEERLKETEEKLLRSLAEIENQRRRFEKEIKDAFEFGSFNFSSVVFSFGGSFGLSPSFVTSLLLGSDLF